MPVSCALYTKDNNMIEERAGQNIFDCNVEMIVNPVNCVGIMGAGLAGQVRDRYPEVFDRYKVACARGALQIGIVHTCSLINPRPKDPLYVCNFPTMFYPGELCKITSIKSGMISLVRSIELHDIRSIAIPKLGCGIGRLSWDMVRQVVIEGLQEAPSVHAILCV